MKRNFMLLALALSLVAACVAQSGPPEPKSDNQKPAEISKETKTEPSREPITKERIHAGSKFYVAPMGGFETYVIAGLMKKQVPILVVNSRDKADYEITGASESQKASWAKMMFMGSQQSHEEASVVIANIRTGTVVFGYNVNKGNSVRGKQSAAEACAKHIKNNIEGHEQ
jgi:hypothetical protein